MILTTREMEWVKDRMKIYVIKYQEIYDEILDHILTAIEEAREAGNTKQIQVLFQDVVDEHFNGYVGIEALAVSAEKIYRKDIQTLFYSRLKQYFNWQALVIAILLLIAGYKLPNVKMVHALLMLTMILLAASPVIYAVSLVTGKIKTNKGKRSLLKTYLITQAAVPVMLLNPILFIPNLMDEMNNKKDFHSFNGLPPVLLMPILIVLLIVNVSYIQSCREVITKKMIP